MPSIPGGSPVIMPSGVRLPSRLTSNSSIVPLGLAIPKGLVQAQAGEIAVERTRRGCRFSIALPLAGVPRRAVVAV